MSPSQFLLAIIEACGGRVQGRTMLQKKAYFVSLLSGLDVNFGFQAHYYGPYSATVDGTLTQLKNLGFVEEASTGFGIVSGGFERLRYDYSITDDGRRILEPFVRSDEYTAIDNAVSKIRDAGDPNYVELSIAAKAFYILEKQGKEMSASELRREAQKFNWTIQEHSLGRAVQFLEYVGLARA